jgi:hypothetical protein
VDEDGRVFPVLHRTLFVLACAEKGVIVLVLVYVDDMLCATNDESAKPELFTRLDEKYGIKDQGELTEYFSVRAQSDDEKITIMQGKYAREILTKFGYENARLVGNPLETRQGWSQWRRPRLLIAVLTTDLQSGC